MYLTQFVRSLKHGKYFGDFYSLSYGYDSYINWGIDHRKCRLRNAPLFVQNLSINDDIIKQFSRIWEIMLPDLEKEYIKRLSFLFKSNNLQIIGYSDPHTHLSSRVLCALHIQVFHENRIEITFNKLWMEVNICVFRSPKTREIKYRIQYFDHDDYNHPRKPVKTRYYITLDNSDIPTVIETIETFIISRNPGIINMLASVHSLPETPIVKIHQNDFYVYKQIKDTSYLYCPPKKTSQTGVIQYILRGFL